MTATARPNFLLFITDQHRADHLGCYGNPIVKTGSIDGIAAKSLRFEKFYVACPICMPNRIVMMTGRMSTVNGSRHNGIPLDLDAVTFVDLLRNAGYRTALIGKSHLQDMTSNPVPDRIEQKPGFSLPPNDLREANRRRRTGPAYEVEIGRQWIENPKRPVPIPYYGFEFVRFANGHGDQVHGHYTGWLKERTADPESLRGWRNALPSPGLVAPQAWRTAVPEKFYPTSYVAEETLAYLDRHAQGAAISRSSCNAHSRTRIIRSHRQAAISTCTIQRRSSCRRASTLSTSTKARSRRNCGLPPLLASRTPVARRRLR